MKKLVQVCAGMKKSLRHQSHLAFNYGELAIIKRGAAIAIIGFEHVRNEISDNNNMLGRIVEWFTCKSEMKTVSIRHSVIAELRRFLRVAA